MPRMTDHDDAGVGRLRTHVSEELGERRSDVVDGFARVFPFVIVGTLVERVESGADAARKSPANSASFPSMENVMRAVSSST